MKCKKCGSKNIVMVPDVTIDKHGYRQDSSYFACNDCGSKDYEFEPGEWGYNDNEDCEL